MPVKTNVETVKLQLAMAFGQGAGSMLAEATAIERLLADKGPLLRMAEKNWEQFRVPFIYHTRLLGQLSANAAGRSGHDQIAWEDIKSSLSPSLAGCPCVHRARPGKVIGGPLARR